MMCSLFFESGCVYMKYTSQSKLVSVSDLPCTLVLSAYKPVTTMVTGNVSDRTCGDGSVGSSIQGGYWRIGTCTRRDLEVSVFEEGAEYHVHYRLQWGCTVQGTIVALYPNAGSGLVLLLMVEMLWAWYRIGGRGVCVCWRIWRGCKRLAVIRDIITISKM